MYSITDEYGGVGLLKFDFLGIKNLAILADAVVRVQETRDITIDIENVPIDDAKTYEMLARGETEGTFQLNGSGMTRWLKELRYDYPRYQRDGCALSPRTDGNYSELYRAQT